MEQDGPLPSHPPEPPLEGASKADRAFPVIQIEVGAKRAN